MTKQAATETTAADRGGSWQLNVTQTPLATRGRVLLAAAAGTPVAVAATRRAAALRAVFATYTRREPTLAT